MEQRGPAAHNSFVSRRNLAGVGTGVYKSLDGGKSWQHVGLESTGAVSEIVLHPSNPDVAYVGALGNTWKESEDRGVYKTTDAGGGWCSLELSGLGKRYFGNFGSQDRTFGRARGWGNVAKTQRSHDAHSVLSCFFTVT